MELKRFEYSQNNSGGSYVMPEWTGPEEQGGVFRQYDWQTEDTDVFVMAKDAAEADSLAERFAGVYFDGSDDCSCCGNRWYSAKW